MHCVRNHRGAAWRHGASPRDLNRVRHGFDRRHDLFSLCHHRRYAAWKSACTPGTARLVSECSVHHTWLAFVPPVGTAIDCIAGQLSARIVERLTRPVVLTLGTRPTVERLFKLSNKTSVRAEALAGVTTFPPTQRGDCNICECRSRRGEVGSNGLILKPVALQLCETDSRLPQAPVPATAKVFLLSDALGVGKPESARCSTDKRPRRPAPKRKHSLGCA